MLTVEELKKLSRKDLQKELEAAHRNKLQLQYSLKMKQEKKSHLKQGNQRYIAQILTLMREEQLKEAMSS